MALNQVDISMMEDIPAPGVAGKIIISDGTDWTSGENTPVGAIVRQATDPTPTDPATPTLGDMILNTGNGKLFNCTNGTAGAAVWTQIGVVPEVVDLSSIENDIALLALQTAINGNLSAYGLKNSWIEQFENSTYIENLTQVDRVTSDEYLASVYTADTVVTPGSGDWTGDTGSYTLTSGGADSTSGDDSIKSNWTSGTGDFTVQLTVTLRSNQVFGMYPVSEDGSFASNQNGGMHGMTNAWWWEGNSAGNATYPQFAGYTQTAFSGGVAIENGDVVQIKRVSGVISIFINGTSRHTYSQTSTADLRFVIAHHGTTDGNVQSMTFTSPASATYATGSFESTDVVPQDATNKDSVGLVMLYKDNGSADCALNTDIVAQVRANTGQAYDSGSNTLALVGAGTYSDGLKIAIAPAISVTAGQLLSYKISFANQVATTKEARIYGVAMTY